MSDNLYCLSNYDLQNIIDYVVPEIVNTVPDRLKISCILDFTS